MTRETRDGLIEALKFYADKKNYGHQFYSTNGRMFSISAITADWGDRARKALDSISDKKGGA